MSTFWYIPFSPVAAERPNLVESLLESNGVVNSSDQSLVPLNSSDQSLVPLAAFPHTEGIYSDSQGIPPPP